MAQKVQYYKGIKFVRYENQKYYIASIGGGNVLLHRFIWLCEKGAIPEGYDVHHKDHDFDHNEISNYELLTRSKHIKLHFEEAPDQFKEQTRDNMRKARLSEKCVKYHSSVEGRKQKSETAKKLWEEGRMTKPNTYTCEICGKEYSRRSKPAKHRFCSYECQRVYEKTPQERVCCICGKTYMSFLGSIGSTCSRSCSVKLNHKNRIKEDL